MTGEMWPHDEAPSGDKFPTKYVMEMVSIGFWKGATQERTKSAIDRRLTPDQFIAELEGTIQ